MHWLELLDWGYDDVTYVYDDVTYMYDDVTGDAVAGAAGLGKPCAGRYSKQSAVRRIF